MTPFLPKPRQRNIYRQYAVRLRMAEYKANAITVNPLFGESPNATPIVGTASAPSAISGNRAKLKEFDRLSDTETYQRTEDKMNIINKIYTRKVVIAVICIFIFLFSCLVYYAIHFNTKELSGNRLLNVRGIYVDDDSFLYISTEMGVLVYENTDCTGCINAGKWLRIAVDNDVVYIWDYGIQKMSATDRTGQVCENARTDVYPVEQFQKDECTKGDITYRVHRILGYTSITNGTKTLYHSPITEYLLSMSVYLLIPCFLYLAFGWVVVYGIIGGRDEKIKHYYREAFRELFRK